MPNRKPMLLCSLIALALLAADASAGNGWDGRWISHVNDEFQITKGKITMISGPRALRGGTFTVTKIKGNDMVGTYEVKDAGLKGTFAWRRDGDKFTGALMPHDFKTRPHRIYSGTRLAHGAERWKPGSERKHRAKVLEDRPPIISYKGTREGKVENFFTAYSLALQTFSLSRSLKSGLTSASNAKSYLSGHAAESALVTKRCKTMVSAFNGANKEAKTNVSIPTSVPDVAIGGMQALLDIASKSVAAGQRLQQRLNRHGGDLRAVIRFEHLEWTCAIRQRWDARRNEWQDLGSRVKVAVRLKAVSKQTITLKAVGRGDFARVAGRVHTKVRQSGGYFKGTRLRALKVLDSCPCQKSPKKVKAKAEEAPTEDPQQWWFDAHNRIDKKYQPRIKALEAQEKELKAKEKVNDAAIRRWTIKHSPARLQRSDAGARAFGDAKKQVELLERKLALLELNKKAKLYPDLKRAYLAGLKARREKVAKAKSRWIQAINWTPAELALRKPLDVKAKSLEKSLRTVAAQLERLDRAKGAEKDKLRKPAKK